MLLAEGGEKEPFKIFQSIWFFLNKAFFKRKYCTRA
jgi:hypothetical protein